jgi:hypothetical protein
MISRWGSDSAHSISIASGRVARVNCSKLLYWKVSVAHKRGCDYVACHRVTDGWIIAVALVFTPSIERQPGGVTGYHDLARDSPNDTRCWRDRWVSGVGLTVELKPCLIPRLYSTTRDPNS